MATPPSPQISTPIIPSSASAAVVGVAISFSLLDILAVVLRFYAQRHSRIGIEIDDYFIAAGLVFTITLAAVAIYAALYCGLGWPVELLTGPIVEKLGKTLDGGQVLWGIAITTIRTALLFFYWRIFPTPRFRMATTVVLSANLVWLVAYLVGASITFANPGSNANAPIFVPFSIAITGLDLLLDVLVLTLPTFVIRTLNLPKKKKAFVLGLLWLGIFCVVASALRLYYLNILSQHLPGSPEFIEAMASTGQWSLTQPAVSLIAACLPTYGPLFKRSTSWGRRLPTPVILVPLRSFKKPKVSTTTTEYSQYATTTGETDSRSGLRSVDETQEDSA